MGQSESSNGKQNEVTFELRKYKDALTDIYNITHTPPNFNLLISLLDKVASEYIGTKNGMQSKEIISKIIQANFNYLVSINDNLVMQPKRQHSKCHVFDPMNVDANLINYCFIDNDTVKLKMKCNTCKQYTETVNIKSIWNSKLATIYSANCDNCGKNNNSNSKVLLPCKCIFHKKCLRESMLTATMTKFDMTAFTCHWHKVVFPDNIISGILGNSWYSICAKHYFNNTSFRYCKLIIRHIRMHAMQEER